MEKEHAITVPPALADIARSRARAKPRVPVEVLAPAKPARNGQPKRWPLFRAGEWRDLAQRLTLSRRQCEILALVFENRSNEEIAQRLKIGLGTVRTHFERMYAKLGVRGRMELVPRVMREYLRMQRSAERDAANRCGDRSPSRTAPPFFLS